ncbi:hypothetical protein LOTGIDRAFT_139047, partial [Lottia gigantea]
LFLGIFICRFVELDLYVEICYYIIATVSSYIFINFLTSICVQIYLYIFSNINLYIFIYFLTSICIQLYLYKFSNINLYPVISLYIF